MQFKFKSLDPLTFKKEGDITTVEAHMGLAHNLTQDEQLLTLSVIESRDIFFNTPPKILQFKKWQIIQIAQCGFLPVSKNFGRLFPEFEFNTENTLLRIYRTNNEHYFKIESIKIDELSGTPRIEHNTFIPISTLEDIAYEFYPEIHSEHYKQHYGRTLRTTPLTTSSVEEIKNKIIEIKTSPEHPANTIVDWGINPVSGLLELPQINISLWMKNEEDLYTDWHKNYTEDDIQPIIVENPK